MRTIQQFYQSLKSSKNKPMCLVYKLNTVGGLGNPYTLPFYPADDYGNPYNYYYPKNMGTITIDWGDGTSNIITDNKINGSDITHSYATRDRVYTIKITSDKFIFPMQWQVDSVQHFRSLTEIDGCFQLCYNPKSSTGNNPALDGETQKSFLGAFQNCDSLTKISQDLFRYNPQITNFGSCFWGDTYLASVPKYLFRYNTNATNFAWCFKDCRRLQLNPDIFCDNETEKATRFAGMTVSFGNCFAIDLAYAGVQGTAPDLWNYTFGSVTSAGCFAGHSTASLTNYNDIPSGWK